CLARAIRRLACTSILAVLACATPCRADDGLLGLFFDRQATSCADQVGSSSAKALYVVFLPGGSSSGGITGAEFRIDGLLGSSFLPMNESIDPAFNTQLGTAVGSGINVAG